MVDSNMESAKVPVDSADTAEPLGKADAFIPFALPDISEFEISSVVDVLRSGWITTGPKTKEFAKRFAASIASPHVVMVNSCTAAMHLALDALGIKPSDEVIDIS